MTLTPKSLLPKAFAAAMAAMLTLAAAGVSRAAPLAQTGRLSSSAIADATFPLPDVPGSPITLTNGKYTNAQNKVTVLLNGPTDTGDLNGDGAIDAAVTLLASTGGSGSLAYLSAVLNDKGTPKPVDSVLLGDRIRVQRVSIGNDGAITVRVLERRFDQPMSARPTIPVTLQFALKGDKLIATGPLSSASLNNAEYFVTLVDGAPAGKSAFTRGRFEDDANRTTATLLPRPRANGDLDGDGSPDAAVIIAANNGGSGTFLTVQAVLNEGYQPRTVAAALLGDRIPVTDVAIKDGRITVTYLERKPDEPMVARPTVEQTVTFVLAGDKLVAEGAAGAAGAPGPAASLGVVYACSGGASFTVVFGPQTASVTFNGRTEVLAQSPTADGFNYENSLWDLRGTGIAATLSDAQTNAVLAGDCQAQQSSEVMAAASGTQAYTCANDQALSVTFGPSVAVITFGGQTETLSPVQTDSGVLYANDKWQLTAKDKAAALTDLKTGQFLAQDCETQGAPTPPAMSAAAAPAPAPVAPAPVAPAAPITPTVPVTPEALALTGKLTGEVFYVQRIALLPDAVVTVRLTQVMADAAPIIATQTIETKGKQVPIPFELTYDLAKIDQEGLYIVEARITEGGKLTWVNTELSFVLTRGYPVDGVKVEVRRVQPMVEMKTAPAPAAAKPEPKTVVDALAADPRFSTLVASVQAAGLVTALQSLPAVTVFAPTNDAFTALGESALKELAGNKGMLEGILLFHVVTPTLLASDVLKATELQPMLGGFTLPVTADGNKVMIKDANILETDIKAGNGVVHVIDKVLVPAETFGMADPTETKVTAAYVCADDKTLDVIYDNGNRTAAVTFGGETRTLQQQPSGSGIRYADDTWELVGKGNEALLNNAKTGEALAGGCFVKGPAASPGLELTGTYESGVLPAADASGRVITLTLSSDGAAAMTTQFIAKGEPMVERGTWTQDGGQANVSLTNTGGTTTTLSFQLSGDTLTLLDSEKAGYGSAGLTLTRVKAGEAASPAPAASLSGVLTGTVYYLQKIALEPNAVVEVQLADVSKADAAATVIATQTIQTQGAQVPIPYSLKYDPAKIDPRFTYAVSARITVDGKLRWINDTRFAVLTRNAPVTGVDIRVIQVTNDAAAAAAAAPKTVAYACANNVTVKVTYNASSADVTYDGKTQTLPQVESGSGIRYSNATWEWNSKGEEGFLTDRKNNTIVADGCKAKK